jgi:hypothetical protein
VPLARRPAYKHVDAAHAIAEIRLERVPSRAESPEGIANVARPEIHFRGKVRAVDLMDARLELDREPNVDTTTLSASRFGNAQTHATAPAEKVDHSHRVAAVLV